ncbi:MAG: DUF692 domain-containing protein [Deltaproteobacteria bacterium]|nr:DUF692 domain-containing protein [Deltaproteobacteria bacterium]
MPFPFLGYGIGLRTKHYGYILSQSPQVDWFEIISENYMVPGGRPLWVLDQIRERYPLVMHGVSLSIGSSDPLNKGYLKSLKNLAQRIHPAWISDHLCWTGVDGHNAHDLLPLPYTEEAAKHLIKRVREVQDYLERPILLENVSSYMTFSSSTLTEWDFLKLVAEESDCFILLDINNIYVSSINHSFDPLEYIQAIPRERVIQFHLAGHSNKGSYLLDTHDHSVKPSVWSLYRKALDRFGKVSTLIEWDERIPAFSKLLSLADKARNITDQIYARSSKHTTPPLEAYFGT